MNLHTFLEEFVDGYKHPYDKKDYIEIFKNPSVKEMMSASRDIKGEVYLRFIANNHTKNIFVFTPTIVHRFISNKIGREMDPAPWELWGVAKKTSKGWTVEHSDMLEYLHPRKKQFLERDWKWLKKWIDVSPLIKKVKEKKSTVSDKLDPSVLGPRAKQVFNSAGKRIEKVSEEFKDGFKVGKHYVEVLSNPSKTELDSISQTHYGNKYIRFIFGKGQFLAFRPDIFHETIHKKYIDKNIDGPDDNYLWGTAKLIKGKWTFDGSDADIPNRFNWNKLKEKGINPSRERNYENGLKPENDFKDWDY